MLSGQLVRRTAFDSFNFAVVASISIIALLSPNEDQVSDLQSTSIYFFGLTLIGCLGSIGLNHFKIKTLGEHLFVTSPQTLHSDDQERPLRKFWGWQLILTLLSVTAMGVYLTQMSLVDLFDIEGMASAANLFRDLVNPNWTLLPIAVIKIIETIFIAFMATALALPLAFVLSFFCAKNIMVSPVAFSIYGLLRTAFNFIRSVEPIIWAIIFSVWVGIGPFAGMLALMVQSVASLAKQFSEIIESAGEGPVEAVLSTGANRVQTVWFGIVPQVVLPFISFSIYRWDINVRMATIIGFAGGGGIGVILNQYSMRAQWPEVGCLILVIAAVVWIMDVASAYLREALK